MAIRWAISTPLGRPAAIAAFDCVADAPAELDRLLTHLGAGTLPEGTRALRRLPSALGDGVVVARVSPTHAVLMPHGSPAVIDALARWLGEATGAEGGLPDRGASDPPDGPTLGDLFPEASDEIEARVLQALPGATGARAVDRLLGEADRWRAHAIGPGAGPNDLPNEGLDRVLAPLLQPAVVAVVGAANIGKSTLLNALAGEGVAVVADAPGTTRDHVGAMVDLDGLTVRWADLPGVVFANHPSTTTGWAEVRPGASAIDAELERAAIARARTVVASADLVVLAGDPQTEPPPAWAALGRPTRTVVLRIDRADPAGLGGAETGRPADARVSVRTGEGLGELAVMLREALVPTAALEDPRPWRFWGLGDAAGLR